MQDQWEVIKEERITVRNGVINSYKFSAKSAGLYTQGITTLTISTCDTWIKKRIETLVSTKNTQTLNNILEAGRQYAASIDSTEPFYFDSASNDSFKDMTYSERQRFLAKNDNLLHCDYPFDKDNLSHAMDKIEESLNVLGQVDPNVLEIIDYMKDEFGLLNSYVLK